MPLRAKTTSAVFRLFQDHLNALLNKVLTRYRLQTFGTERERALLAFLDRRRQPIAVPLPPSPWYLSLEQELQAVPEGKGRGYVLKTLQYAYRIQLAPLIQEEAVVRFEYVSRHVDPSFRYPRHHVQFHRDYDSVRGDFSPHKHHIPTGWVTIEEVIRFLITDLGVPPLTDRWDEELRESEEKFKEWTGRDVPE